MKQNLYYPFEVLYKELELSEKVGDVHNFFELVYVLDGTGKQIINKNVFEYTAGHLLLVTPQDNCHFELGTPSKFLHVCFSDVYIKSGPIQVNCTERENWTRRLEFILNNASHLPGCILKNPKDKVLVKSIIESILDETKNADLYSSELIQQLMNSLIILVARTIAQTLPERLSPATDKKLLDIFLYINENIYNPQLLKVNVICKVFNISTNYLGKYFKKNTSRTLQEYILDYKAKLIETRLLSSDMRISEIVDELHFTDESHLNRFFKKHRGMSPTLYRKSRVNNYL